MYDSRLGRRWNVDPVERLAKDWTPYRAFFNNPIFWTDHLGLLEDQWILNSEIGELTKVGDQGGDEYQIILIDAEIDSETGGVYGSKSTHVLFTPSNQIYTGPIAKDYDGNFHYGVSNKDI